METQLIKSYKKLSTQRLCDNWASWLISCVLKEGNIELLNSCVTHAITANAGDSCTNQTMRNIQVNTTFKRQHKVSISVTKKIRTIQVSHCTSEQSTALQEWQLQAG